MLSDKLRAFAQTLSFQLDPFQITACESIADGRGVLVAAPTGAGKTVVADFAVYCSIASVRDKVFYTTPIKALSNQKFQELQSKYGAENVGLLTGDTNINATARIVVMTTEVLRNMIYAGSELLSDLAFVIMDEVHYLADRFRGAVWEEIIIQLPRSVAVVSLSATVSNAEEFGAWLAEVRGATDIVVSEYRPVPLTQHVLVGDELIDLFTTSASGKVVINESLLRLGGVSGRGGGRGGRNSGSRRSGRGSSTRRIDRWQTINILNRQGLLPAIFFIFSRAGCESALHQVAHADLHLTSSSEKAQIRSIIEAACSDIPEEDLGVLDFWSWSAALEQGVAAHHAGMLPTFKEVVEELFIKRLVKVVFATETLALGVNMPARSVVLERLDKFNGTQRAPITAGEYTQFTGRAGRRGIDPEGHAIIQWRDDTNAEYVASLATKRTYPLYSSFKPTYNMAVNLIDRIGRDATRNILESSFAQFQADRQVVGLARQLAEQRESLEGYSDSFHCSRGDFAEYASIRNSISTLERESSSAAGRQASRSRSDGVKRELDELRRQMRRHPCHQCPDREKHARWAERWFALAKRSRTLEKQIRSRTGAISRTFDRVTDILERLGYLGQSADGRLAATADGERLKRIYGERDLLISECIREGIWSGVDVPTLCALVSVMVHEPRREEEDEAPAMPRGLFRSRYETLLGHWAQLDDLERDGGMPGSSRPSAGFAFAAHRWASGASLHRVLGDGELTAGDFVRRMKQVVDVLDQITHADDGELADQAKAATTALRRGVVLYSNAGQ